MRKIFVILVILFSVVFGNCNMEEPDRSGPSCTPQIIFDSKDLYECWDESEYCHFCSYKGGNCTTVAECYNNPDLDDDIYGVWNKKYMICGN